MKRSADKAPVAVMQSQSYLVAMSNHVRLARPYSLLWFVSVPVVTMALWLRGPAVPAQSLVLLILSFSLADAGLTTLNDISDRSTDRASLERQRHMRPVATGSVSVRSAYIQVVILETCALVAALGVSPLFLGLVSMGVLYGVGYSVRPIYAGGRPVISQAFWIVVWPAMYVGVYIGVGGDFAAGLPYVAATVLFMGVGETLAKDLRDIDNDSLTGKRTTPVAVGVKTSTTLSTGALVLGAIAYVLAAATTQRDVPALASAIAVIVGLWCARVLELTKMLRSTYTKANARALHMGCIRVFLTANLLFITGLGTN